jgi:voltage-gated potassium channel Kch
MLTKLLAAWLIMGGCVAIHAAGVSAAVRALPAAALVANRFWPSTRMFIRLAGWIVVLHLLEIVAWALFYRLRSAMPDLPSALYFSAVTYTTTGYGDLVLPAQWRLVGAVEALTGILMCGWSTGFFVAAVGRTFSEGASAPAPGAAAR